MLADFITACYRNLVRCCYVSSPFGDPNAPYRLCFLHNQVNERLGKAEFDCANLDATYDCGCGDEPVGSSKTATNDPMDLERDPSRDKAAMGLVKGGRALS